MYWDEAAPAQRGRVKALFTYTTVSSVRRTKNCTGSICEPLMILLMKQIYSVRELFKTTLGTIEKHVTAISMAYMTETMVFSQQPSIVEFSYFNFKIKSITI